MKIFKLFSLNKRRTTAPTSNINKENSSLVMKVTVRIRLDSSLMFAKVKNALNMLTQGRGTDLMLSMSLLR